MNTVEVLISFSRMSGSAASFVDEMAHGFGGQHSDVGIDPAGRFTVKYSIPQCLCDRFISEIDCVGDVEQVSVLS